MHQILCNAEYLSLYTFFVYMSCHYTNKVEQQYWYKLQAFFYTQVFSSWWLHRLNISSLPNSCLEQQSRLIQLIPQRRLRTFNVWGMVASSAELSVSDINPVADKSTLLVVVISVR